MTRIGLVLVAVSVLFGMGCSGGAGGSSDDHVTLDECRANVGVAQVAELTILNKGAEAADYEVVVAFISKTNGNQLGTGVARVTGLLPGRSTKTKAEYRLATNVLCEIVDVTRVGR